MAKKSVILMILLSFLIIPDALATVSYEGDIYIPLWTKQITVKVEDNGTAINGANVDGSIGNQTLMFLNSAEGYYSADVFFDEEGIHRLIVTANGERIEKTLFITDSAELINYRTASVIDESFDKITYRINNFISNLGIESINLVTINSEIEQPIKKTKPEARIRESKISWHIPVLNKGSTKQGYIDIEIDKELMRDKLEILPSYSDFFDKVEETQKIKISNTLELDIPNKQEYIVTPISIYKFIQNSALYGDKITYDIALKISGSGNLTVDDEGKIYELGEISGINYITYGMEFAREMLDREIIIEGAVLIDGNTKVKSFPVQLIVPGLDSEEDIHNEITGESVGLGKMEGDTNIVAVVIIIVCVMVIIISVLRKKN